LDWVKDQPNTNEVEQATRRPTHPHTALGFPN
jgi:hypothetical protein